MDHSAIGFNRWSDRIFAFDVVKTRVDIWLNPPWLDASGSAWQLAQAQIAIATGGITGTGPVWAARNLSQSPYPIYLHRDRRRIRLARHKRVLLSLLFIILRGIHIALCSKTTFGRYLAFGISAFFALQTIFIVSGNLGG